MKKLLAAIAAVVISAATYGQGQVNFDTLTVGAPILMPDGTGPGAAGRAQLYLLSGADYAAVGPIQGFLTVNDEAMKYISATAVTIDGIASGEEATFQVRAWVGADSWELATIRGSSGDVTVELGGGLTVPPNLDGLEGFTLVPEPSTIALAVLGVGAFLLRRRKK